MPSSSSLISTTSPALISAPRRVLAGGPPPPPSCTSSRSVLPFCAKNGPTNDLSVPFAPSCRLAWVPAADGEQRRAGEPHADRDVQEALEGPATALPSRPSSSATFTPRARGGARGDRLRGARRRRGRPEAPFGLEADAEHRRAARREVDGGRPASSGAEKRTVTLAPGRRSSPRTVTCAKPFSSRRWAERKATLAARFADPSGHRTCGSAIESSGRR